MNKVAKIISYLAFVFAFCCMAIGYAAVQDTLLVSGSVSVKAPNKIFAVYGDAFDSNGESIGKALNFYNRPEVKVNDTIQLLNDDGTMIYETQTVEVIYENIDTAVYTSRDDVPWNVYNNDVNTAIKTMRVVDEGIAPVSTAYWFAQKSTMTTDVNELHTIDVTKLDTSHVTTMESMFAYCNKVTEIDLSNFNTFNVKSMKYMFRNCFGLTQLNLDEFDTENVTDMEGMFWSCNHLTSLHVNHFNTSNVANMKNLFRNCSVLTELDLSNFNTKRVTTMEGMFASCRAMVTLDLSGFETPELRSIYMLFNNCAKLTTVYVSEKWTTESVYYSGQMFSTALIGGAGSTQANAGDGLSAARIDGGPSAPGLFTYKYYAIIFDGNNDNASDVPKMTLSEVNTFTLPQPPSHPWATFLGWATTADATAPEYTGDTFTSSSAAPYCDVFYAVWGNLGVTEQVDFAGEVDQANGSSVIIGGGDWVFTAWIDFNPDSSKKLDLTIWEGNFDGWMMHITNADVVINGGVFTCTDPNETQFVINVGGNNNTKVTVNGGDFRSFNSLMFFDGNSIIQGNITGGIFGFNPSEYVPATHTVVNNGDGTWTVVAAE